MIDLGPGGGAEGGRVVASGHPLDLAAKPGKFSRSATAAALAGWLLRHRPARGRKAPSSLAHA